jgi:hypothetical protein
VAFGGRRLADIGYGKVTFRASGPAKPQPALVAAAPVRRAWARSSAAVALALAILASAIAPSTAAADVGRFAVHPRAVVPASIAELTFAAAWAQRFPVSLVPLARVPPPYPCHRDGLCEPAALAPPRRRPFRLLGSVRPDRRHSGRYIYRYRFRFRVPHLEPGAYAFVLFCAGCYRGPRGSLIASVDPADGRRAAGVLRVRSSSVRGRRSNVSL